LIEIEVGIKCHGQAFKVLTIESHERNWNGCNCNNKEAAVKKQSLFGLREEHFIMKKEYQWMKINSCIYM
jgi:hypothetical protein